MPYWLQNFPKSFETYSPPPSVLRTLILWSLFLSTMDLNFLNTSSTSSFLLIRYVHTFLLWSSMKMTKYILSPMKSTCTGPHTSKPPQDDTWFTTCIFAEFSLMLLRFQTLFTHFSRYVDQWQPSYHFVLLQGIKILKIKMPFHVQYFLISVVAIHLCSITFNSTFKVLFGTTWAFMTKSSFVAITRSTLFSIWIL